MLHNQLSKKLVHQIPPKFKFIFANQTQQSKLFSSLLDLCKNQQQLQQLHARFILHGHHQNPIFSSKLIDNYANFGLFHLWQQVYNSNSNPNRTVLCSFIGNLYKRGEFENVLLVYKEMVAKSIYPDEYAFHLVLNSCFRLRCFQIGNMIHGHVVKLDFDLDESMGVALVEMYNARQMLDEISRNSYKDYVTIVDLLRASVEMESLRLGRSIHGLVFLINMSGCLDVNTALLTMYTKLGSLKDARLVFDEMLQRDCVVWNLMISAYSDTGNTVEPFELLAHMVSSGIRPDLFTAIAVISSVADSKSLSLGKQIHAHVVRNGSDYQVSVHNSLIDMYCKCNSISSARNVFDSLINKSLISWSSIIKGYVNNNESHEALSLFARMKSQDFKIDSVTIINILPACVNIGALKEVKILHGYSTKSGLNNPRSLNTSLLVSYAKCGCIENARKLFDECEHNDKDIITWNSMISAYSKHGDSLKSFELYNKMKESKLKPDKCTFLALLTACVNSGSLKEGWVFYNDMTVTYKYEPNPKHYACMVDLLGRAGCFKEAEELIKSIPYSPDSKIWGPLLSASKLHSNTGIAEFAAERLISMEPKNAGNYVLLSNIYAAAGKWDKVAKMRVFLRDKGLKKTSGCSWIETNGKVHEFRVADQSHSEKEDIYNVLSVLEFEIMGIKNKCCSKMF